MLRKILTMVDYYEIRRLKLNVSMFIVCFEHLLKDTGEVVNLLLKYCDVNVRDKYASTPLHFCAMRSNVAAAQVLLEQYNVIVNVGLINILHAFQ